MPLSARIVATALLTLAAACGSAPGSETPPAEPAAEPAPSSPVPVEPSAGPWFTGTVTQTDERGRVLVEASPGAEGTRKVWVAIGPRTVVLDPSGTPTERGAVRVGRVVRVTFRGAVLESYPEQAMGDTVRVER